MTKHLQLHAVAATMLVFTAGLLIGCGPMTPDTELLEGVWVVSSVTATTGGVVVQVQDIDDTYVFTFRDGTSSFAFPTGGGEEVEVTGTYVVDEQAATVTITPDDADETIEFSYALPTVDRLELSLSDTVVEETLTVAVSFEIVLDRRL